MAEYRYTAEWTWRTIDALLMPPPPPHTPSYRQRGRERWGDKGANGRGGGVGEGDCMMTCKQTDGGTQTDPCGQAGSPAICFTCPVADTLSPSSLPPHLLLTCPSGRHRPSLVLGQALCTLCFRSGTSPPPPPLPPFPPPLLCPASDACFTEARKARKYERTSVCVAYLYETFFFAFSCSPFSSSSYPDSSSFSSSS